MTRRFPINDLHALVQKALKDGEYTPAESARVRAVPDTRTIRYYTTLGLIRAPVEMAGRTALYDETHVLQLVAIKRLQAKKQTLSDIQKRIIGMSNKKLASIAKLPSGFWPAADDFLSLKRSASTLDNERLDIAPGDFWTAPASMLVSHATKHRPPPKDATSPVQIKSKSSTELADIRTCLGLSLAVGVELLVSMPRSMSLKDKEATDFQAINTAAQPLILELIRQGIWPNQDSFELNSE